MDLAPLFPVPFILLAVVAHEYEKTERSMWVHDINLKRGEVGEYFHLFPDLLNNEKTFFKYFRMSAEKFFELFELLPLKKMDTNYRKAVSPAERLAVTLKMSRGQRLLELALHAHADPAHEALTFIVNNDGSLTVVDEVAESALDTFNDSGLTTNPVDIPDQVNMHEEDINPCENGTNLSENVIDIPEQEDLGNIPEEDITPCENDINLPENVTDIPEQEESGNKPEEDNPCENVINLSENVVGIPDQEESGDILEEDTNPCENNINLSENSIDISEQEESPIRKRKKRHQVKIATLKVNQWKEARKKGKEYCGKRKNYAGQYD